MPGMVVPAYADGGPRIPQDLFSSVRVPFRVPPSSCRESYSGMTPPKQPSSRPGPRAPDQPSRWLTLHRAKKSFRDIDVRVANPTLSGPIAGMDSDTAQSTDH